MPHKYIELIFYKTYADLKAETRRTYLGFLWWIFEPVMYMFVLYMVFGLGFRSGGKDFVPFLLVGLIVFQWFRNTINHSANAILGERGLMQRVYLPKIIFPLILILTDTFKFLVIFFLLLVFLWFWGFPLGFSYLGLPALLFTQLLFLSGLALLNSAIIPFLPDLRFVVDNILTAVFFMSGIFFSVDRIPEKYQIYFFLNPMATLIHEYRGILMENRMPNWSALLLISLVSLLLILAAIKLIKRFEYIYPRLLP